MISSQVPHHPAYGFDSAALRPCSQAAQVFLAAIAAGALHAAVPISLGHQARREEALSWDAESSRPPPHLRRLGPRIFPLDRVYPRAILGCMKTTLQRWGNSQGVRLPKSIVESLGIAVGAAVIVEISEDRSQITITPMTESRPIRGRHRIEDLIAASAPQAFGVEDHWGRVAGKEVW